MLLNKDATEGGLPSATSIEQHNWLTTISPVPSTDSWGRVREVWVGGMEVGGLTGQIHSRQFVRGMRKKNLSFNLQGAAPLK